MKKVIDDEFMKELLEQRVPTVLELLEEYKFYGSKSVIKDLVELVQKYMNNDSYKFIINDMLDKPIKIIESGYTTDIVDDNYVFTKREHVVIKSEGHLMEYIRLKLREGFNINITNNKNSATVNIEL